MVEVLHNKYFLKRQFEQDRQTLMIDYKEAVPVAIVDTDELEEAYQKTNNIDTPWVTNAKVMVNIRVINGTRSTSVGDFLLRDSILYVVGAVGFVQLSNAYDVYRNQHDTAKCCRYMTATNAEVAKYAAKTIGGVVVKR